MWLRRTNGETEQQPQRPGREGLRPLDVYVQEVGVSRKKQAAKAALSKQPKSPEKALKEALKSKTAFGQSKFQDKVSGVDTSTKIYSYSTYENYVKEGQLFVRWCQEHTAAKTLEEMREHRQAYIQDNLDRGLSPATVKKRVAALNKVYGDKIQGLQVPNRVRSGITRSRLENTNSANFSESRNKGLVEFCRATGLRRHELAALKPEQVRMVDGRLHVCDVQGKGGRVRDVPVVKGGEEAVLRAVYGCKDSERVFSTLPSHADIHSYRAEYCAAIYKEHERDLTTLPRSELYCCRGDKAGVWYDRQAMMAASEALGHSRIDVMAEHYLYKL